MATEKITKKDNFNTLKAFVLGETAEIDVDAMVEFIDNEIAALDRKAAKAKEAAEKKKAENDELGDIVASVLTDEFTSIPEITEKVNAILPEGSEEVSAAKVSNRLSKLVKNGLAVKDQANVPATEVSKARKIVVYATLNAAE